MLTPEEQQIVEAGARTGKSKEAILGALSNYRAQNQAAQPAPAEKKKGNIFSDIGGTVKRGVNAVGGFVGDVKDAAVNQFQGFKSDLKQIAGEDQKLGFSDVGRVGLSVAGRGSKVAVDTIGAGIKAGVKTVLPPEQQQYVKDQVVKAIQSSTGQKILGKFEDLSEAYKEWEKDHPDQATDLNNLLRIGDLATNLTGIKLGVKGGEKLVETGIKTAKTVGEGAISGTKAGAKYVGESVTNLANKAGDVIAPVAQKFGDAGSILTESARRIPSNIATNVAAKQATEKAIKELPSVVAQNAARDGVKLADVKAVVTHATDPANKQAVKELATAARDFASGASNVDPIEVVGRPIVTKLKQLESAGQSVGKKIGKVAENLGSVSKEEAAPAVTNSLRSVKGLEGLKVNKNGVLNFAETTLASDANKSARKEIQALFDRAIKSGSGVNKNRLRQEIFELLGGKKSSLQNLTETQEKALEAIRKGLGDILDTKNPAYKTLNQQYAKIQNPLKEMRKLMKSTRGLGEADDDILDMSAGLLARRLTSNASSNPQIRNILRTMDRLVVKGGKSEAKTEALQDLYNVLNKYYDISGGTTFQSGVKEGVANISGGITENVIKAGRKLAGETEAVRQKAIENLIEELTR